jgi:chorismate-pyruvate lyase
MRSHPWVPVLAVLSCFLSGAALADARPAGTDDPPGLPAPSWPDDRFHRVAALALLEQLRANLLAEHSATLVLERWCADNRLAARPVVVARQDPGASRALPPDGRTLLGIGPDEPVRYRRVRLLCGERLLSEADNWYVPSRLTPEMNRTLDTTTVPFGKVVQPLRFTRTTLAGQLLWSPRPDGWAVGHPEAAGTGPLPVPDDVLQMRAVLLRADRAPISLVAETYKRGVLALPAPPTP